MKGQAALEYMIVLGIALTVAMPFVMKAQSSVVDIRSSVSVVESQDTLNDIDVAVRTVDAAGEPAARTVEARLPDNLRSTEVRNNSISIFLTTPSGNQRLSRTFDAELTGSLPDSPGLYLVRVRAKDGEVEIEVVS